MAPLFFGGIRLGFVATINKGKGGLLTIFAVSKQKKQKNGFPVNNINRHGSKQWKAKHDCHKRSLNDTVMHRFKAISGDKLDARLMKDQPVEAQLKCLTLNRFTGIAMPDSYKAA
ncbi:hypothetical protein FACS1894181_15880 [Bacteroidia bacterium]|nr:hypothetical protein FACS1894181_15880 [Bacteroidia bacterium]